MSIVLLIFVIILIYYKLKRRLKLTPPPPPPHLVPVHGSVDSLVLLCAIFSTITLFSNDLSKRPCFKKKHKLCMSRWVVYKKAIEEGGMFLIGIGENRDLWPRWRLRVRDFLNTKQCLCVTSVILVGKSNSHRHSRAIANGAGGGGKGGSCPPWTCCVKQIESVDGFFFSVDSVILVIVIAIVCHFLIRGRFFGDISHDKWWR